MWQEYAIEPAALVRSLKEFNVFSAGLGWEQGRLLVKFPSEYKRFVAQALMDSPEQDIKKATITNRLQALYERALVGARRDNPPTDGWPAKALAANAADPFHAIITLVGIAGTLALDDFDPTQAPWVNPSDKIIPRTAQALAAEAKRIFNHASEVVIIDPHFAPNRPHVAAVLEAYLDSRNHTPGSAFRLSLHVGPRVLEAGIGRPPFTNNAFALAVTGRVAAMLRSGQVVAVNIWNEIAGGERFHDRYILCQHGGLSIPGGADTGNPNETTTIARVSAATARQIIARFKQSAAGAAIRVYDHIHSFEVK
ncbi:MAG TPA: hypothetical protein VFT72_17035 [Opitutaceae bacterium]|nr:hypothetical protein [Opitutaceae bacterium]